MSRRPLTVAMNGATGRMGTRIIQLIDEADDLRLGAAIERPGHPRLGEDVGPIAGPRADRRPADRPARPGRSTS